MKKSFISCIMFFVLVAAPHAWGWSTKEHILLTRLAVQQLLNDPATPPGLKQWVAKACPDAGTLQDAENFFKYARVGIVPPGVVGASYWCVMPDINANSAKDVNVEPFGVPERLLHFVDLEYFHSGDTQPSFATGGAHCPKPADVPNDLRDPRWKNAGMLPLRIVDCAARMTQELKQGRLWDQPGQYPRDQHAVHWAGFLAHYAADNTMPHHGTIDYKSRAFFDDVKNVPNVHAEMEYRMCDDDHNDFMELRNEFWPLLLAALADQKAPAAGGDMFTDSVKVSIASYDTLDLIGHAAAAATHNGKLDTVAFFHYSGPCRGKVMSIMQVKAIQQAWAVQRIATVWTQAWNAAQPPEEQAGK